MSLVYLLPHKLCAGGKKVSCSICFQDLFMEKKRSLLRGSQSAAENSVAKFKILLQFCLPWRVPEDGAPMRKWEESWLWIYQWNRGWKMPNHWTWNVSQKPIRFNKPQAEFQWNNCFSFCLHAFSPNTHTHTHSFNWYLSPWVCSKGIPETTWFSFRSCLAV